MAVDKYPEPSYAVVLWYAAGQIHVQMDGHVLRIPIQGEWYNGLLTLLRRRAAKGEPSKIAAPESLTNWQMEQLLKKSVKHVGRKKRHLALEDIL